MQNNLIRYFLHGNLFDIFHHQNMLFFALLFYLSNLTSPIFNTSYSFWCAHLYLFLFTFLQLLWYLHYFFACFFELICYDCLGFAVFLHLIHMLLHLWSNMIQLSLWWELCFVYCFCFCLYFRFWKTSIFLLLRWVHAHPLFINKDKIIRAHI